MAEFPAFPLWTDAYLGDTTHLTTLEHGAYLLLLMVAWRSKEGTLPDDDVLLSRYAKLRLDHWRKIRPIIQSFFKVENGIWIQGRLKDELESVKLLSKVQSKKARGRWANYSAAKALKNNNSDNANALIQHMPKGCPKDAYPSPIPSPTPSKIKSSHHTEPRERKTKPPQQEDDFRKMNFDVDFYLDDDDRAMENVYAPQWDKRMLQQAFNDWIKQPTQSLPRSPAKAYLKWLENTKKCMPPR